MVPGDPPNPDFYNVPPSTSRISQQRNTLEFRSLFAVNGPRVSQVKFNASFNDYTQSEFTTAQDAGGVSDSKANHFHKCAYNGVLQLQQRHRVDIEGASGLWATPVDT